VLFEPAPDPVVGQLFLQRRQPLHLVGVKREDIVQSAKGTLADESPFQDIPQIRVGHPLDELTEENSFPIIVQAGNLHELLGVVLQLFPESLILIIDRNKKYLAGVPVEKIDQVRIGIFKRFQKVFPVDLHILRHIHQEILKIRHPHLYLYLYLLFRYSAVMRKVFIADAHLRTETDENYRFLLEFLAGLPGNTDTLFIMGDLFEFWIGYREVPFTHYFPVLELLRQLRDKGVEIVYFEGNHDFHMGPFFVETLRARVFRGPAEFDLDGKKVYLCHGDQIITADYGYRLLRFLFHNRLTRAIIPLVPPAVPIYIADRLGRKSKESHRQHQHKWDYPTILREFAADRFHEGYDAVISGHFHLPLLEQTADGTGRTLLSLGDWITHYSYGEWAEGKFSLRKYR
jgi:UDP-2,3-diacylglucosamine hydrolase